MVLLSILPNFPHYSYLLILFWIYLLTYKLIIFWSLSFSSLSSPFHPNIDITRTLSVPLFTFSSPLLISTRTIKGLKPSPTLYSLFCPNIGITRTLPIPQSTFSPSFSLSTGTITGLRPFPSTPFNLSQYQNII